MVQGSGAADVMPERSRARHGNALRAGVLGSTDGLVSNLSLVMGVAGSGAPRETIIVAGLAGLVAGSLSMALGEYLSVPSTRWLARNWGSIGRDLLEAGDEIGVLPPEILRQVDEALIIGTGIIDGATRITTS